MTRVPARSIDVTCSSINYVYKLPFFNKSSGLDKSILGGWEIAGTVIAATGTIPANQGVGLSLSYDPIGLGGGYTNRPNSAARPLPEADERQRQWFDPSNFSAPVPAWLGGPNQGFGNAGKDAVVGPGRVNFTTSLYKSFSITERAHIELRFESFNTFNHFQPNGCTPPLATATSARSPARGIHAPWNSAASSSSNSTLKQGAAGQSRPRPFLCTAVWAATVCA